MTMAHQRHWSWLLVALTINLSLSDSFFVLCIEDEENVEMTTSPGESQDQDYLSGLVELYSMDSSGERRREWLDGGFWVAGHGGRTPKSGAVVGGIENGVEILVARASTKEGDGIIPGKFHPTYHLAYILARNTEISTGDYEILVAKPGTVTWVPRSYARALENGTVIGGTAGYGRQLYICRCPFERTLSGLSMVPGYLELGPGVQLCWFPWGGNTHSCTNYQLLVGTTKSKGEMDLGYWILALVCVVLFLLAFVFFILWVTRPGKIIEEVTPDMVKMAGENTAGKGKWWPKPKMVATRGYQNLGA